MMSFSGLRIYTYYRGRVALYALLRALGISKGDDVITQAFTCVAVPEGIMATGARPVWVDIGEKCYNMDPYDLENKITSKTRALIIQHTYGIPADIDKIIKIAREHELCVIEDCCHTLASKYNNKTVGRFGKGSFYSFEWGKPIVIGIGGAAVANDLQLRKNLEDQYDSFVFPSLRNTIKLQLQYLIYQLFYRPKLYWPLRRLFHISSSFRLAEGNYNPIQELNKSKDFSMKMAISLQKRLARKKRKLNEVKSHSLYATTRYRNEISSAKIEHPVVSPKCNVIFSRYPINVEKKTSLLLGAKKANVELASWYSTPVHPLSLDKLSLVHYQLGSCPNAEKRCKEIVTLPTHFAVKKRDIDRAISFLNEFYS